MKAFPCEWTEWNPDYEWFDLMTGKTHKGNHVKQQSTGMDLRDYFAAKAIEGMLSNSNNQRLERFDLPVFAKVAYEMADAMMKAREQ